MCPAGHMHLHAVGINDSHLGVEACASARRADETPPGAARRAARLLLGVALAAAVATVAMRGRLRPGRSALVEGRPSEHDNALLPFSNVWRNVWRNEGHPRPAPSALPLGNSSALVGGAGNATARESAGLAHPAQSGRLARDPDAPGAHPAMSAAAARRSENDYFRRDMERAFQTKQYLAHHSEDQAERQRRAAGDAKHSAELSRAHAAQLPSFLEQQREQLESRLHRAFTRNARRENTRQGQRALARAAAHPAAHQRVPQMRETSTSHPKHQVVEFR
jgi:hypothetical protein